MITEKKVIISPPKKKVCGLAIRPPTSIHKTENDSDNIVANTVGESGDDSFQFLDESWIEDPDVLDSIEQIENNSQDAQNNDEPPPNGSKVTFESNNTGVTLIPDESRVNCWIKNVLKQNIEAVPPVVQDTPEDSCRALFFGLPIKVKELLESCRGISELHDWQKECLSLSVVKEGKNFIYSLPTSGGKTLVAEILIFREVLCKFRNAIFILPYISIVQEKVRALSPFAVDLDFAVEEYAGTKGTFPPRKRSKRRTVYVATIEKAHSLVNSLIEEGRIEELGLAVVDELHMLYEEGDRGAILEIMLTKLMFMSRRLQILGMSATLKYIEKLKIFLNASSYSADFRPVDLEEYIKLENKIFKVSRIGKTYELESIRQLNFKYSREMKVRDPDFLVGLVLEVVPLQSCLIFCPTKKHCENVALLLAKLMPPSARTYRESEKDVLMDSLTQENTGLICPVLKRSIRCGVAYHHSGLTADERLLIEEAYMAGILCCLVCTSTLAAGVNLPAKRVIIRAPYIGTSLLTATRYKQMIGRAGRAGMTDSGESILILKQTDVSQLERVLVSSEEEFSSALEDSQNMQAFLLGLIGMQVTSESEAVVQLIRCSLFAAGREESDVRSSVDDALDKLKEAGMITIHDGRCVVTNMGRAAHKSGVGLMFSSELYCDLQNSLKMLSLQTHLHLLYIVTPYHFGSVSIIPDVYFRTFLSLGVDDQHAASLIGVNESLVTRLIAGRLPKQADPRILPRFYLTMILYDLWNQRSIWEVAEKYSLHRGTIHSLLTSASTFGSCVSRFCQELPEFWALAELMPNFVKQLSYCVSLELVALMELPAVKKGRARQLFCAGYKTLADVAKASPGELVEKIEHLPRRVAHQMVAAAKMLLLEKVEALQEEAQEIALAVQQQ